MTDYPEPGKAVCDNAQALARKLFGQALRDVAFVPRGVMNHKFKVTLRDGNAYGFRFYPPTRERVVEYEPDLLKRCGLLGLPVPKVLVDSRCGPEVGQRYLVYHWIQGVPMDERLPSLSPGHFAAISRELLGFLQSLASLTVTGFGDLESATRARCRSWPEFLQTSLAEALAEPGNGLWDRETTSLLQSVIQHAASSQPDLKPVLAWGDISPENVLLDSQDRLTGIVDFEGTLAADFSLTIGYCYARFQGTPFFESLWNAWPDRGHLEVGQTMQVGAVLRALRLARFARFPLPTGCPRKPVSQILPGFQAALNQYRNRDRTGREPK